MPPPFSGGKRLISGTTGRRFKRDVWLTFLSGWWDFLKKILIISFLIRSTVPNPDFQIGVKSAAQYQPWAFGWDFGELSRAAHAEAISRPSDRGVEWVDFLSQFGKLIQKLKDWVNNQWKISASYGLKKALQNDWKGRVDKVQGEQGFCKEVGEGCRWLCFTFQGLTPCLFRGAAEQLQGEES